MEKSFWFAKDAFIGNVEKRSKRHKKTYIGIRISMREKKGK